MYQVRHKLVSLPQRAHLPLKRRELRDPRAGLRRDSRLNPGERHHCSRSLLRVDEGGCAIRCELGANHASISTNERLTTFVERDDCGVEVSASRATLLTIA